MNSTSFKFWATFGLVGALLSIYLFATAPIPLESTGESHPTLSTAEAFELLAHENDVTRTLFTKAIVGAGKQQGLLFSEHWADPEIHAGPLPALFLRGVAAHLAASPVPLGLFLGSDQPIESSNRFQGRQAEEFEAMRKDPQPRIFLDEESGSTIGMFPDFASAPACVSCHNDHERSAKHNWVLNDLMGATTWSYPSDSVTTDEFLGMLKAYRAGVAEVWTAYLAKVDVMDGVPRPGVGEAWPKQGLFLPDLMTFQDSILHLAAPALVNELVKKSS
jgi:hypothetical protein